MSWWDAKGFTSLATQALKNAQKKIDKVLDIDEEERNKSGTKAAKTSQAKATTGKTAAPEETSDTWNSWNSWLGYKPSGEGQEAGKTTSHSSWSLPWGLQDTTSSEGASSGSSTKGIEASGSSAKSAASKASPASSPWPSSLSFGSSSKSSAAKSKQESPLSSGVGVSQPATVDCEQVKEETAVTDVTKRGSTLLDFSASRAGETPATESTNPAASVAGAEREEDEARTDDGDRSEREADEEPSKGESAVRSLLLGAAIASEPGAEVSDRVQETDTEHADSVVLESSISETVVKTNVPGETEPNPQNQVLDSVGAWSVSPANASDQIDGQTERTVSEEHTSKDSEPEAPVNTQDEQTFGFQTGEGSYSSEPFETITRDSSKDALESFDTVASVQGSCDESDLHIPSDEVRFPDTSTSLTSNSSEPILLSLSGEGNVTDTVVPQADQTVTEVDAFSPQSHSSVLSEEDAERKSPLPETLGESDERTSSVVSPHMDSTATLSSESSETSRLDSSIDTVVEGRHSQSEVEDSHGEELMLGSLSDADANSPSASFVKCVIEDIEEAMEDVSKLEDSGSDNHSEEKSESSKVDSEFEKSVYSGHESSDEIETTTSSDIEIISTPTPNGEKNIVDLSPLKFSLQKAASARALGQGHQRSDSQSSSSTHSKGDPEQLFHERDLDHDRQEWQREGKGHEHHESAAASSSQDDLDNPQHPQRLLKNCKNQQDRDLVKKLAEMAEILQARETRLVQLSKDNNDLLETNSILRSQLQQAEEEKATEMTDLNALTEEFSKRMGESERKLQAVMKEKEALKQQLQKAEGELSKRAADVSLQALLEEKDEQIAGLMEEGEKLSKQQLQNSNIIKKLRVKEKENEGVLASQKKKIEQQTTELEQLKKVLDAKEDMEKKQADAIKQLNAAVQMLEKEKAKMKVEVDTAEEKIRGLQATLDNSYKEIAELHKSNASQDSRAQQAALSAEMQVREELKMAMEEEAQKHRQEKEALISQIEDLRLSIARMEKDHNRREEMLKQEISDLQMRLQEDESRTQDLTQSVTSATRPLLRQIENLQTTHSIQTAAWERVEKNLTDRLSEAQTALAMAQEKERAATEKLAEVSSRCTALETSNSQLRQEKAHLLAQRDSDQRKIDMLEERKANDIAQLELTKKKLSEEVASLRKDKVFLESQLETERSRLEAERQRVAVAEEQIRILERERPRSRGTPSPVSISRQESMASSFVSEGASTPVSMHRSWHDDSEGFLMTSPSIKTSLYDTMRQTGGTAYVENLQAQLKLREGEIAQLQEDIQQLEKTRESMARELVNLTNLNEELQDKVEQLPKLQENYQALDSRYNALLQMYGEKEEQVQELMLDLQDVKDMYKSQINALMPK